MNDIRPFEPGLERQDKPLSLPDYFGEKVLVAPFDKELRDNALLLLTRVNRLMSQFGQYRRVVLGFEPIATLPSRHQSAQAVDLADPDGDLDQWLLDNQILLERCGLWIEHPASTRGHCHLQSMPPKGGGKRRVFYPVLVFLCLSALLPLFLHVTPIQ